MVQLYATSPLITVHGRWTCLVYRDASAAEHVALTLGSLKGKQHVLCRVHSECMTSEVFGSLHCDCKQQLDMALLKIQEKGEGVLIYLRQEGRGIGLGNKILAYAAQQNRGLDTVDANTALGFREDARDYQTAADILKNIGVISVDLMTNNPEKIEALKHYGIHVENRVEHYSHNLHPIAQSYMQVKKKRLRHF